jgi:UDP-2,4-diacetamido-2,4,6-trideoxy-beta-L-altropyranose hydrolase
VNPGTLVIRADASIAMGTGHVMRCLALAQAWQDVNGDVVFAMAESTAAIARRLQDEGIEIARLECRPGSADDAEEIASTCQRQCAEWIVVDGYHFDLEYQQRLKDAGLKLLLIDDSGQVGPYIADVVLNQNVHAAKVSYRNRATDTRLLLGPRYALLRREFRSWCKHQRPVARIARNLLITMGGSDPQNVTAIVLTALRLLKIRELKIKVVVGGSNPHVARLRDLISRLPNAHLQTDVTKMAELVAWADLAITAGGGTCYELALMGTPMLLFTMAENHAATCRALEQLGAGVHVGWFHNITADRLAEALRDLMFDRERRRRVTDNARRLVDGNGAYRVVENVLSVHREAIARACSA